MTNKINLIELLSLFRPCGDFSNSNHKINVYDFYTSKLKISEPLQGFIKDYFSPNADLIFDAPIETFWIDQNFGNINIYIDSSIYKPPRERFIKIYNLTELLDPQQPLRVSYWAFGCDSTTNLTSECFSTCIGPNLELFEAYDMPDGFVTNLTVRHLGKNTPYEFVINAFGLNPSTQLYKLANYKYKD